MHPLGGGLDTEVEKSSRYQVLTEVSGGGDDVRGEDEEGPTESVDDKTWEKNIDMLLELLEMEVEEELLVESLRNEGKEDDWIIWEDKVNNYKKELEKVAEETELRISKANKLHKSWELHNACRDFIRENDKIWKSNSMERRKENEKKERHKKIEMKKGKEKEKMVQKKITVEDIT